MEASLSQNFSELAALFLAEIIRSRKTSLGRAAEISRQVLRMLPQMNSEGETLSALTEIEKEFDEVRSLKQALNFGYKASDIKVYEKEIKEFASRVLTYDINLSSVFLQDAARRDTTIQELCVKYPEFCNYLFANSEKGELLPELRPA